MTYRELKESLERLSGEDFERCMAECGMAAANRQDLLGRWPDMTEADERRICAALGLKTEREKEVEAVVAVALAAKETAAAAKGSATAAVTACVVAALAFVGQILPRLFGPGF